MKFDTAPEFASGLKSHPTVITHDQCDSAASAILKARGFITSNLTLPILIFLEKYDDDALVTPIRIFVPLQVFTSKLAPTMIRLESYLTRWELNQTVFLYSKKFTDAESTLSSKPTQRSLS
jgi:hypothetical protein